MKRRILLQWLAVCMIALSVQARTPAWTEPASAADTLGVIDADDCNIRYVGRFDLTDPKIAVFDWPGVEIRAGFEGTSCSIRLKDGKNYYTVQIDGGPPQVLKTDGRAEYILAQGLSDIVVHAVLIQKRTETFVGKGEFSGFILDKGRKLPAPDKRPERRIEFIGNSITCGYGVEGTDPACHFTPETENASLSYATVAAWALNAECSLVAYSGRGVVRNYGDKNKTSPDPMPSLIDRTCCFDSTRKWDFTRWIPQAVVVNLGTNDFSTKPFPDKQVFQEAYVRLIHRIRTLYPGVHIFCMSGPMIGEPCTEMIREAVGQSRKGGSEGVRFIEVPRSMMADNDWGCDWHPNVRGQQKIADLIVPVIGSVMNW